LGGGAGGPGIVLPAGGSIVNAGTITGGGGGGDGGYRGFGIVLSAGGKIANAGTIAGGSAIFLEAGGVVTNGSAGDRTALITGGVGIDVNGTAGVTVTNFGTIASTNGSPGFAAVLFNNANSVLVLEGGSRIIGEAFGGLGAYGLFGDGALDLAGAGGPGTLSGLGRQYRNFAQVAVLAGADWTLGGGNTIGSGTTLTVLGTLDAGGHIEVVSGGVEIVAAGGVASGTAVRNGGTETVFGRASGGTVGSGGRQVVSAGGVASGATMTIGGDQTVSSGGTARDTVVSGGAEYVRGTASGTVIDSHGIENVHGVALGGTVNSGGQLRVSAGGVDSGSTVNSGGTETVFGRASGGVIDGGLIKVASGGIASGTVTFAGGGTLELDAGAGFTGKVKGFAAPDRIDLRSVAFGAATTRSFTEAASHTSGTLTVTDGTHTVQLTLLGQYLTSNFTLSTDNHGGTRVTDPPIAGGAAQITFADIAIGSYAGGWPRDASGSPGAPAGINALSDSAAQTGGTSLIAVAHGGYDATLVPVR
jgi:autotransporter passenger strand-loop-strand repeat protein